MWCIQSMAGGGWGSAGVRSRQWEEVGVWRPSLFPPLVCKHSSVDVQVFRGAQVSCDMSVSPAELVRLTETCWLTSFLSSFCRCQHNDVWLQQTAAQPTRRLLSQPGGCASHKYAALMWLSSVKTNKSNLCVCGQ